MKKHVWIWIAALILLAAVTTWLLRNKFATLMGKAMWPTPGHTRITSPFGKRIHPVTGVEGAMHNGIDIAAPLGTPVLSPFSGVVESVYSNATGGNQVVVRHDNGYTTGYAHLSVVLVDKGERVAAGEPIAQSGNTGASTGPHLHFTVRKNGQLMDPQTLFA